MLEYMGLALAVCGADLIVKETVKESVDTNQKIYTCNNKVIITKFYNPGAMLGAFGEHPGFIKGVTVFGLGALVGALAAISGHKGERLQKFGLSLMIGGASSNAFERFRYGMVTDYIQFNFKNKKFRRVIYNVGDFAIFGGSFLLCLGELLHRDK